MDDGLLGDQNAIQNSLAARRRVPISRYSSDGYCLDQQGTVGEGLCGVALNALLPVDLKCSEWIFAIESIGRKLLSINELLLPARNPGLEDGKGRHEFACCIAESWQSPVECT
jgi:hypothetical protein